MNRLLPVLSAALAAFPLFAAPTPPSASMTFPGPEGIAYPDFTYAGVPGGIPKLRVAASLSEFGGRPGADIADALEKGAKAVAAKGGGALLIPAGVYYLDRPVLITQSGVVIRGAGRDQTKLVFRWEPAPNSVDFIGLKDGDTIPLERSITVATWNESRDNQLAHSIERLALEINGTTVSELKKTPSNEGPWFSLSPDNRRTAELLFPGKNELVATVAYTDGRTAEKRISVLVDTSPGLVGATPRDAAITFAEPTAINADSWGRVLQETMPRGSNVLRVGHDDWKPGDVVQVNDREGGYWFGHPLLVIASVKDYTLTFTQPVRRDISIVNVRRRPVLRGSGLEDFTLEQTSQHWTNLVNFERDYGCWIRGVRLLNAGRNPIGGMMKNFELRDSIIDGARFHFGVGGGTGYLGFSNAQDCLMENVQAARLRHAPNFQYGSMGCVIRNSVFEDSDAQLHAAPNWENLLENCVINSRGTNQSYGSYGACLWLVARPKTTPLGAGLVVYGNDFSGFNGAPGGKALAFDGGAGTGFVFAYNRFIQDTGRAVLFSEFPTEIRLHKNHFITMLPGEFAIEGDVSRLSLVGNRFAPWKENALFADGAKPLLNRETFAGPASGVKFPGVDSAPNAKIRMQEFADFVTAVRKSLPRPAAPAPSLFAAQKTAAAAKR